MPPTTMQSQSAYDFGQALKWLEGRKKVTRAGWNGKGMYVYLVYDNQFIVGDDYDNEMLIGIYAEGQMLHRAARFDMRYASGQIGVWTPTPEDLLAKDWRILE